MWTVVNILCHTFLASVIACVADNIYIFCHNEFNIMHHYRKSVRLEHISNFKKNEKTRFKITFHESPGRGVTNETSDPDKNFMIIYF